MTSQSTKKQTESEAPEKTTKKELGGKLVDGAFTGIEWLGRIVVGIIFVAVGCGLIWLAFAAPTIEFIYKAGLVIVGGLAIWNGVNALRGANYWAIIG